MATVTGTAQSETLVGTPADDLIKPNGIAPGQSPDVMSGLNGADVYDLTPAVGTSPVHDYIIDDNGTDGVAGQIIGAGPLTTSGTLGYQGFATAERIGDDLVIVTPYKPASFRDPAKPTYTITIVDQYAGEEIASIEAGGSLYALPTGTRGTAGADLMAGAGIADLLNGGSGDDFITGNTGDDTLKGGAGSDQIFGGDGSDQILGQNDNDWLYGGTGNDTVSGGRGFDFLYLEDGNDVATGGADNDYIYGQNGNDKILGQAGADLLSGGRGDDTLKGGADGDIYRFGYDVDNYGSMDDPGHDVIRDKGEAPSYLNTDRIDLFGYYGPSDGLSADAYARVSFDKSGNDMVIISDGGQDSLTVKGQFSASNTTQIEELNFYGAYWDPLAFEILDAAKTDVSNDRAYGFGETGERNEIIFGTNGADEVFGNSGTNFIWLGGGADTLIYKEADPQPASSAGGGAAHDIVEDFDIAADVMDFTEIAGLGMADLVISQDSDGDATIYWDSGTWEVSDILIELRGVAQADVTADLFLFA